MFTIENKPVPHNGRPGRRLNPIAETMRKLEVGQSFFVPRDHPAWTGSQVRNENHRKRGYFVSVPESNGFRIGRVK